MKYSVIRIIFHTPFLIYYKHIHMKRNLKYNFDKSNLNVQLHRKFACFCFILNMLYSPQFMLLIMYLRSITLFSLSLSNSFTYGILHIFLCTLCLINHSLTIYINELHWFQYSDWFSTLLRVYRTQLWCIRTVLYFVLSSS